MLSIRNLAHQLFPRQSAYFLDAYKQACANPYGYLLGNMKNRCNKIYHHLVNLHANSNNILRLRTSIFPGEENTVFIPKNG
jgi:hypothetical protein